MQATTSYVISLSLTLVLETEWLQGDVVNGRPLPREVVLSTLLGREYFKPKCQGSDIVADTILMLYLRENFNVKSTSTKLCR